MSSIPHVVRVGARYHFRRRLHFRNIISRPVGISLRTADPVEARKKRVDAEASRLASLGATITGALSAEGLDHYAVGMKDPEGNEFDIN